MWETRKEKKVSWGNEKAHGERSKHHKEICPVRGELPYWAFPPCMSPVVSLFIHLFKHWTCFLEAFVLGKKKKKVSKTLCCCFAFGAHIRGMRQDTTELRSLAVPPEWCSCGLTARVHLKWNHEKGNRNQLFGFTWHSVLWDPVKQQDIS